MTIAFNRDELSKVVCPPTGRPEKDGRFWVPDPKVPGLGLRVTETGKKAFYLYRRIPGKSSPSKIRLGDFATMSIDAARRKAGGYNSSIAAGFDPVQDKADKRAAAERAVATFRDLWTAYRHEYLADNAKARTVTEYERIWKAELEVWADRPVASITAEDCELLKTRVGAKGHHMANRVIELVSAMFRRSGRKFGLPKRWAPTADVERYTEKARDRVLSPEELARVIAAIDADENATARDYFKMLLYTGVRKTNVAQMRWQDVSDQRGTWKIAGETTKNGEPLVVNLVPEAAAILASRSESNPIDSPFVFPANRPTAAQVEGARGMKAAGKTTREIAQALKVSQSTAVRIIRSDHVAGAHAPFGGAAKVWQRILVRAGITDRTTIHDVRRTFCTNLIEAGVPLPIVAAAMGHKSMATTQRHYSFARQDKVAEAVKLGVAGMLANAKQAGEAVEAKRKARAG